MEVKPKSNVRQRSYLNNHQETKDSVARKNTSVLPFNLGLQLQCTTPHTIYLRNMAIGEFPWTTCQQVT